MNRTEHLLTILAEECAEVAQRATKALRFGLEEIQPGSPFDNSTRITHEYADLLAVVKMLQTDGSLPVRDLRLLHFLEYSAQIGTLEP